MNRRLAIVAAVAWAIASSGAAGSISAQTATFTARREAVRVDVLVTSNGRVVRGLQAEDFDVRDNGVAQPIDLVTFQQIPLNVILVLDVSASVSGDRLEHLRGAGRAVLGGLTIEDRAALITFSHVVTLRQALTADVERVRDALDRVDPLGETALVDGIYAAITVGESDAGRTLVLVFSDGIDTSSWLTDDSVLTAARRSDVVVYGVAVRGVEKPQLLRDLSELTGGGMVEVESTKDLQATFVRILDEFWQRYLVSYSPQGVAATGWHRLEVRVRGRSAAVKARAGYEAGSPR